MTVATFVGAILKQMRDISKPQQKFLTHIFVLYMSIRGRINFSQMSRYGTYNEGTYHNQFKESFDFINFNKNLIKRQGSGEYLLVFDPTYLPKAGSKTPEVGNFWSGCAGQMKKGLEFGVFGLIDIHQHTCYHLYANQTPSPTTLKEDLEQPLLTYYSCLIKNMSSKVKEMTKYLVVDAYFSKKYFIDKIMKNSHFQVISRLRRDAKLRYLYKGEQKPRGRPRRYAGSVDWDDLDLSYFKLVSSNAQERVYEAVLNYEAFGRDLKIAFVESLDEAGNRKSYRIYFSTDLSLDALTIVHYYKLRFQVEFEIRDAKQFTGLTECQSTNYEKLNFHVNTSLTAVSVAKAVYWADTALEETKAPFSMADVKSLNFNQLFAEKILALSPEAADLIKKNPEFHNLLKLGVFNYQEAA